MLPVGMSPQVLASPDVLSAIRYSMELGQDPSGAIGLPPPTLAEMLVRPQVSPIEASPEPEDSFGIGVARSFASALVPEALGMRPSARVEQFRAEHPTAGFATEVAGLLGGYAGGVGLTN